MNESIYKSCGFIQYISEILVLAYRKHGVLTVFQVTLSSDQINRGNKIREVKKKILCMRYFRK